MIVPRKTLYANFQVVPDLAEVEQLNNRILQLRRGAQTRDTPAQIAAVEKELLAAQERTANGPKFVLSLEIVAIAPVEKAFVPLVISDSGDGILGPRIVSAYSLAGNGMTLHSINETNMAEATRPKAKPTKAPREKGVLAALKSEDK